MSINISKRPPSSEFLDYQSVPKIQKTEPVFPQERVCQPCDLVFHRFKRVPCIKKNAVHVEGTPLHANKIKIEKCELEAVAGQAPLMEDKSKFWKAIFDGDYMIIDLTTQKDQRKGDDRSLGVRPYYPELCNEDYKLDYHTLKLISDDGILKKYSVQDHQTGKIKELLRVHFADWPEYKVLSLEKLAHLVNIIALYGNNKIWVHCRDGAKRAPLVIAAALIKEEISKGVIHLGNLNESVDYLEYDIKDQRLKSLPDNEQKVLLLEYAKSLLS